MNVDELVSMTEDVAISILRLENQKKRINEDIKDIKSEAKSNGIEMKLVMNAIKNLKRIMKDEDEELSEEEFLLEKFNKNTDIVNLVQELVQKD